MFLNVNCFHQNFKFVTKIQHIDTQKFKTQYLKTQLVLKLYKSSALAKQIYMRKENVLVSSETHHLEKSDVLNNSQISKLYGIDYEFILLSE